MKKALRWSALLLLPATLLSQTSPPKREFRGAWIATVVNLDWPSSPALAPEAQRQELLRLLDDLHAAGVNAVLFQIRPECDALYASPLEPWSYWLTGRQGQAPEPFYDPLAFAVDEAHRRGMELHAWFNPYRAVRQTGSYTNAVQHVVLQHPDWVISIGTLKFLNPGLPQVREHVTNVVLDVVKRYQVDGVHFDDYFYPYPPHQISSEDAATFAQNNRGFTNIADWRRDNVNLLIQLVHDSLQAVKPFLRFGISPFGIWKNGVPAGISGLDAFSAIYCDAVTWLNRQIVDYITPQLYWPFGGGQDYGKLMPWWSSQAQARHFYPGHAVFNLRDGNWPANELPRQIRANRGHAGVQGSIFFRAAHMRENLKGFTDSLKTNLYRYLALPPVMPWKGQTSPQPPQRFRYARLPGAGVAALQWEAPPATAGGDSTSRYVLYGFDRPNIQPGDLNNARNLAMIVAQRMVQPKNSNARYFAVTALDRNANESPASEVAAITPPATPVLAAPEDQIIAQPPQVALRWNFSEGAASYDLEVSINADFNGQFLIHTAGVVDTFNLVTGMQGQTAYYWRVRAQNIAGNSVYSAARSFTTGFPATPFLASPNHNAQNVALQPALVWRTARGAAAYHLQLSRSAAFDSSAITVDLKNFADTSYAVNALSANTSYFWRVRAGNEIGVSNWSEIFSFKTGTGASIAENPAVPNKFYLYQNHPNPFNPVTVIRFDLPRAGTVKLKIFDTIGREVLTLLDHEMPAGQHEVPFDGRRVTSGVYYYRLEFGRQYLSRRMLLTK